MAYSVREERQSLATSLREELDEAERVIIQVWRDNVESFLQLLDSIEERFTQLETSGLDLRPEQTRWMHPIRRATFCWEVWLKWKAILVRPSTFSRRRISWQ